MSRSGPDPGPRAAVAAVAALIFLHLVLLVPTYPENIAPAAFFVASIELPIVVIVLAAGRGPAAVLARTVAALALTIFTVFKLADVIAYLGFARPFNPVVDPSLIPIALETLSKTSIFLVVLAIIGVLSLVGAVAVVSLWVVRAIASPLLRPKLLLLGLALLICTLALRLTPLSDRVVSEATTYVITEVANVTGSLEAARQFKRDVAADPFQHIPEERLLARLKGTDVLLIFVEAYGRTALDDPGGAPARQLAASEAAVRAAGYSMRSTWMLSPTFGGASWLAHGTLVSGLWIADHQRYNSLFVSEHKTLIHDFGRAGWRTIAVMPLFTRPWPEGRFFGYDEIYTANNLGYAGPRFGYITMPDQYVLSAFHAREMIGAGRKPVMLEMALNSSHLPWTPRPHFLPWEDVGDGSIFSREREGEDVDVDWLAPQKMRGQYEKAVTYAIKTVFSYAETQVKDPALIIIVGDHQPIPLVSGTSASYEVPIHILARDAALLSSFDGWADGLMPEAKSPVWKMDAMRGHILKAFSDLPPQ